MPYSLLDSSFFRFDGTPRPDDDVVAYLFSFDDDGSKLGGTDLRSHDILDPGEPEQEGRVNSVPLLYTVARVLTNTPVLVVVRAIMLCPFVPFAALAGLSSK